MRGRLVGIARGASWEGRVSIDLTWKVAELRKRPICAWPLVAHPHHHRWVRRLFWISRKILTPSQTCVPVPAAKYLPKSGWIGIGIVSFETAASNTKPGAMSQLWGFREKLLRNCGGILAGDICQWPSRTLSLIPGISAVSSCKSKSWYNFPSQRWKGFLRLGLEYWFV